MSIHLPAPATEMARAVERGEYLTAALPNGSIIATHGRCWIKGEMTWIGLGGKPITCDAWAQVGAETPTAARDLDALMRTGQARVIRVGPQDVTP